MYDIMAPQAITLLANATHMNETHVYNVIVASKPLIGSIHIMAITIATIVYFIALKFSHDYVMQLHKLNTKCDVVDSFVIRFGAPFVPSFITWVIIIALTDAIIGIYLPEYLVIKSIASAMNMTIL